MAINDYNNKRRATGQTSQHEAGLSRAERSPGIQGRANLAGAPNKQSTTGSDTFVESRSQFSTPPSSPHQQTPASVLKGRSKEIDTRALASSGHQSVESSSSSIYECFEDALQAPVWGVTAGLAGAPSALFLALSASQSV